MSRIFGKIFGGDNLKLLENEEFNKAFHTLGVGAQGEVLNALQVGSLGNIGGIFNNPSFSNLTGALGAANGIFKAWSSYSNAKKNLKEQKRMNNLLERQMNIENQRYDTELKKRDDASATIAASASSFQAVPQSTQNQENLFERQ